MDLHAETRQAFLDMAAEHYDMTPDEVKEMTDDEDEDLDVLVKASIAVTKQVVVGELSYLLTFLAVDECTRDDIRARIKEWESDQVGART